MNIHDRLFVEIHPMEGGLIAHPHPVTEGRFDPSLIYKVLGMYNASETSECYFILVNPRRQIWFIPQRHLLAFGLIDSNEFFLTREVASQLSLGTPPPPSGVQSGADHPSLNIGMNGTPVEQAVAGGVVMNGVAGRAASNGSGRGGSTNGAHSAAGEPRVGF